MTGRQAEERGRTARERKQEKRTDLGLAGGPETSRAAWKGKGRETDRWTVCERAEPNQQANQRTRRRGLLPNLPCNPGGQCASAYPLND